jgi:hypothetical protein
MPLAWLLLMLAGHDAAQTERTIALRVPEGPRSASDVIAQCELRNAKGERESQDGRLRRGTGLTWLWSCLPGDLVSCDAPGREPVDITALSCAEPDAPVSLQAARQIVLTSQAGAEPLTLEWLVERKEGGLQRLALRSFAAATPLLSVPVGDGNRVLRVHRRSAAPVSIPIEPEPRSQTYKVPPPQAGGEIFTVASVWPLINADVSTCRCARLDTCQPSCGR